MPLTGLELLAPARNADIGIAAIGCGADAVYIAGPEFGARKAAGNSMEEIRRLCGYAHLFGARIFLTLNTILYDDELPEAERLLEEAKDAGVDAVIAQDLAVFGILGRNGTPHGNQDGKGAYLPVHASTQCAIRTPEEARFYESLGATRLVLERELSLEQVKAIREAVDCELESFVHGALCVCYSGQCYMSEAIAGRSANRGACIQACRSLYDLVAPGGKVLAKDKALLSLKDYNLLGRLEDLADAGIGSFKIEGRLKSVSYVRNVVKAYSEALDRLVEKHPERYRRASFGRVSGGFTPDLDKTFNRGYTELFLDGKRGKWSSMDAPKSIGEPIGTVLEIRPLAGAAVGRRPGPAMEKRGRTSPARGGGAPETGMQVLVRLDDPGTKLDNGDGFSFISKNQNGIVGFRGDTCLGTRITCKPVPELYVGAKLYRNLSSAFEKELESNPPARTVPVEVDIFVADGDSDLPPAGQAAGRDGFKLCVKAVSQDGREVSFEMDAGTEAAANTERMEALFSSQVSKATGIYSFNLRRVEVGTSGGKLPFLPASMLNGLRRDIASRLGRMPCKAIPLPGTGQASPAAPYGPGPAGCPAELSYKANVSNKVAEGIYRGHGAVRIGPAFELSPVEGAELMRTKYCIRHELGLCRRWASADPSPVPVTASPAHAGDLFLVNNGRRYTLRFDCARCEMTVLKD